MENLYYAMQMAHKIILAVFVIFIVNACAPWSSAFPPPYSVPFGSTVSINQDLAVNPNSLRVTIQNGKIISRRNVNSWQANCHFELYTMSDEARTIYKDEVEITDFSNNQDYVAAGQRMYASLLTAGAAADPLATIYITQMTLKSQKQPDLVLLECRVLDDPRMATYLTMDQIQATLGDIVTINSAK